jgi:mannose-6-phosphate isomerase
LKGDVSVVANGELKGKSLTEIINEAPNEILGTEVYKDLESNFLFKYLDARKIYLFKYILMMN